jgi:hypothetical protein
MSNYEVCIHGHYGGYSWSYKNIKHEFASIQNLKRSQTSDYMCFDFCANWEADTLKELQEKIWKYFHGNAYKASGLWFFDNGRMKDNKTGNSWNINSWGRVERKEQRNGRT